MPNPESNPPATTPAPPPPAANQPTPSNANPGMEAQSKLAAELDRMFPGGAIPDGGHSNSEAARMRQAGRESSIAAAAATPPGSTIPPSGVIPPSVPPQPVPTTPAAPPQPAQPTQAPTTPAVQTPEEKAAAEKAAAEKQTEDAKAAAIKAAAEAGKPKVLTDAERDAAQAAMTPQAGTAFKNLRTELSEAKKALQAKEAQISEAQTKLSKTLATEEATKLKEKLQQAEDRLAIFDYKSTSEYQDQVALPLINVEAEIKAIAAKNQISEADLMSAMNDPDRLAELSSNFHRLDLMRFDKLVLAREDFQKFGQQLEAQAADKLKNYSSIQEAEAARQQEAARADWAKALDTTQEELANTMPIFKPTGDPQFDADMAAAISTVKTTDLTKLSNTDIAKVFYRNAAFDLVLGLVTNLHNKNMELDTRVKQLSGTAAPAGAGSSKPTEQTQPQYTSMLDAVRATIPQVLP